MSRSSSLRWSVSAVVFLVALSAAIAASAAPASGGETFPPLLDSYGDSEMKGLLEVLANRVHQQPLNLWATLIFVGAILHTFFAQKFLHVAHVLEERSKAGGGNLRGGAWAQLFHFLGEVEVIFGIWCVPLFILLAAKLGWGLAVNYIDHRVSYIEPVFVVVIMAIASTRPVLTLAENCMSLFARMSGGGPAAWWMVILTIGPVLGSLITEPAAMTISALLLAKQFYELKPAPRLAYATLGLLFVNISVGGVLTHFAAPPVLMVAGPWGWTTPFMVRHFGWAAAMGIVVSNAVYFMVLRKTFPKRDPAVDAAKQELKEAAIPFWITVVHLAFMAWSVLNSHHPAMLIGGLLFFLAFHEITRTHQSDFKLRSPLLVGFFLAGLVIHGGLQQWWIGPVLGRLTEVPLMMGATLLTAFNDNAAITYLATLVPGLGDTLKYAVVAGAVAGGGLTVIANAPNPAGQSILGRYFPDGISPLNLLLGALPATVVMIFCFLCAR